MFTLATQFPKYPPLNYLLDYQHLVLKKLFSEYKFKGIYMNCQHTYGLLFKKLFRLIFDTTYAKEVVLFSE